VRTLPRLAPPSNLATLLNNVFGGIGVGLINLITFAILTVFLVGMMIGRTPEFLGKKIEAREMKLVMMGVGEQRSRKSG
jgi:K+-transporting ATPase A subunit